MAKQYHWLDKAEPLRRPLNGEKIGLSVRFLSPSPESLDIQLVQISIWRSEEGEDVYLQFGVEVDHGKLWA